MDVPLLAAAVHIVDERRQWRRQRWRCGALGARVRAMARPLGVVLRSSAAQAPAAATAATAAAAAAAAQAIAAAAIVFAAEATAVAVAGEVIRGEQGVVRGRSLGCCGL